MTTTAERIKRKSHRERLRDLLSDHRWHTIEEMQAAGGNRYGGRLFELRREHLIIETKRVGTDNFEYRWVREGQGALL